MIAAIIIGIFIALAIIFIIESYGMPHEMVYNHDQQREAYLNLQKKNDKHDE